MAQTYRCGQCNEVWPYHEEFKECPGCGTPCACLASDTIDEPDVDEAHSRARHVRFDRFLREETEEQRQERQSRSPYREEFHRVIEGAGFQEWERESIEHAEEQLKEKAA